MSATIDSNRVVTLTGDGFGVNWGRKQLIQAPPTAVKMQFAMRLFWANNKTTFGNYTARAWDSCSFIGLGFTDEIYAFSSDTIAPSDFFGMLTTSRYYTSGPVYDANAKLYDVYTSPTPDLGAPWGSGAGTPIQNGAMMNGAGVKVREITEIGAANNTCSQLSWPINATDGATFTLAWEVWGSVLDNTVFMRTIRDMTSLAKGDAMFTAFDGKSVGTGVNDILENTIHGDTTSNWRNAGSPGTMNFPRWLKIKCALPELSLVLDYWKIRFLDATNTVVREQAM